MMINDPARSVSTHGVTESAAFGISRVDEVHIMGILRDTLYSDKILAVLREYSANAWDANRVAGRGDRPIEVTLPTNLAPTLTIRDHGPGLSKDDVFCVYTQYGASTKRSDDLTVGKLGIGSKSAFAYSDSFTISSWYGGKKSVYIAVLDESNRGRIDLAHEETLTENAFETGVEISVAVRKEDIYEFSQKAITLFEHFSPRPIVNVELPDEPIEAVTLKNGSIVPLGRDEGGAWTAIMGCVPYRVNLDQLDKSLLNKALRSLSGKIVFPIGAVEISASREELKYSTGTKERIVSKFDELIDEYVEQTLSLIDNSVITEFDKRLRLLVMEGLDLGDAIPGEWESYRKMHVKVIDPGASPLTMIHNKNAVGSVTVTKNLRFLIDDNGKKNLAGYALGYDDYVIRASKAKTTVAELQKHVTDALSAANLTGTPVVLLSTLQWSPTRNGRPISVQKNKKHKQVSFVLKPCLHYSRPYSDHWSATEKEGESTDVFVVLEHFEEYGNKRFYEQYAEDALLAKEFGFSMPIVYGYKSTKKKPISESDLTGVPYHKWREDMISSLKTPVNEKLVRSYYYVRHTFQKFSNNPRKPVRIELTKILGRRHAIIQFLASNDKAIKVLSGKNRHLLDRFAARAGYVADTKAEDDLKAIVKIYPLLKVGNGISSLWKSDHYGYENDKTSWREWLRYVCLVDKANKENV